VPHLVIECSSNVRDAVPAEAIVKAIHDAAVSTRIFPTAGVRTRLYVADACLVGDGSPENGFVHVRAHIAAGRDLETQRRAGEAIFAALRALFARSDRANRTALSLEVTEIVPQVSFRSNPLHETTAAP
jgi:5-carboxymethyl-2-hydroxymuconate isomerase